MSLERPAQPVSRQECQFSNRKSLGHISYVYDSQNLSGPEKGVITKGVFSMEESLESPEKGVITKGVFSMEESLESLNFSRISRKWSDSPLFSTLWGFSRISRISKFSRISRIWTFLKRPLFQETPFSGPESHSH